MIVGLFLLYHHHSDTSNSLQPNPLALLFDNKRLLFSISGTPLSRQSAQKQLTLFSSHKTAIIQSTFLVLNTHSSTTLNVNMWSTWAHQERHISFESDVFSSFSSFFNQHYMQGSYFSNVLKFTHTCSSTTPNGAHGPYVLIKKDTFSFKSDVFFQISTIIKLVHMQWQFTKTIIHAFLGYFFFFFGLNFAVTSSQNLLDQWYTRLVCTHLNVCILYAEFKHGNINMNSELCKHMKFEIVWQCDPLFVLGTHMERITWNGYKHFIKVLWGKVLPPRSHNLIMLGYLLPEFGLDEKTINVKPHPVWPNYILPRPDWTEAIHHRPQS